MSPTDETLISEKLYVYCKATVEFRMRRCGRLEKENDAKAPNVLGVGSLNLGNASMCAAPARVLRNAAVEVPLTLTTRPRAQVPASQDRYRHQ